jgi:hypothetical protein
VEARAEPSVETVTQETRRPAQGTGCQGERITSGTRDLWQVRTLLPVDAERPEEEMAQAGKVGLLAWILDRCRRIVYNVLQYSASGQPPKGREHRGLGLGSRRRDKAMPDLLGQTPIERYRLSGMGCQPGSTLTAEDIAHCSVSTSPLTGRSA